MSCCRGARVWTAVQGGYLGFELLHREDIKVELLPGEANRLMLATSAMMPLWRDGSRAQLLHVGDVCAAAQIMLFLIAGKSVSSP